MDFFSLDNLIALIVFGAGSIIFNNYQEKAYEEYDARMLKAESAEEAMKLRKSFKSEVNGWAVLAALISAVCFIVYGLAKNYIQEGSFLENDSIKYILIIALVFFVIDCIANLFFSKEFKEVWDQVTTQTTSEFMQANKNYILYLRAFENDTYGGGLSSREAEHLMKKQEEEGGALTNPERMTFSENELIREIKEYTDYPVCAIGMTKELQHADGAVRIYTNDNTWKEDVKRLMQDALAIYILISDRESCIFELELSKDTIDKTIYIIDDIEGYNSAIAALSTTTQFPTLPTDNDAFHFIYKTDNTFKIIDFSDDYKQLVLPLQQFIHHNKADISGFSKAINEFCAQFSGNNIDDDGLIKQLNTDISNACPISINDCATITEADITTDSFSFDIALDADEDSIARIHDIKTQAIVDTTNHLHEATLQDIKEGMLTIKCVVSTKSGEITKAFTIDRLDFADDLG